MEQCLKCDAVIPAGYEFICVTCGFGPMCDACYYDHCVQDLHDEMAGEDDGGGN